MCWLENRCTTSWISLGFEEDAANACRYYYFSATSPCWEAPMVSWRKDTFLCNTAANPVSLRGLLQFQIDIYETFLRCTERILSMFHPSIPSSTNISPIYLISTYLLSVRADQSLSMTNIRFNKAMRQQGIFSSFKRYVCLDLEYYVEYRVSNDFFYYYVQIFLENNESNYFIRRKF